MAHLDQTRTDVRFRCEESLAGFSTSFQKRFASIPETPRRNLRISLIQIAFKQSCSKEKNFFYLSTFLAFLPIKNLRAHTPTVEGNVMGKKKGLSSGCGLNRIGFVASVLMIVVYVALSLPLVSHAQFECLVLCEEKLANCVLTAHGDPVAGTMCQDNYDACCAACVGF